MCKDYVVELVRDRDRECRQTLAREKLAELAAREQKAMQQSELAEARQYDDDLKFLPAAGPPRNKLLLGLEQGLTIEPDHFAHAPEKLAVAEESLQSIDRDV